MTYGDFELRNISLDPKRPPSIEVILTLSSHPKIEPAIDTFAKHFNIQHIPIQSLLPDILHDPDHARRQRSLSPLHAHTLESILDHGERVPAHLLIPILKRTIDQYVQKGQRRFVITGLAEDGNAAKLFSLEIAVPSAMFAFLDAEEMAQQYEAGMEKFYSPKLLIIDVEKDEDGLFEKLMAAIACRVCGQDGAKLEKTGHDRRHRFGRMNGASGKIEMREEEAMVENSSDMDISEGSN